MVPKNRFELPTFRLQGDCTTVVLHRHWLRGLDSNQRPSDYEPEKLPTAIPRDLELFGCGRGN